MTAFVFPGQGAQFKGMGKAWYENNDTAKACFEEANTILGYRLSDIMFEGSDDELKQTKVTQPAIFLHAMVAIRMAGADLKPQAVAGHSLGEFSALVAANVLSFSDGLRLVQQRALAMQKACELSESTMAAIVGLEDEKVENICTAIDDVVPANYNCPGQLVISGSLSGIETAVEQLKAAGARKTVVLSVGGAFHSSFMEPAREELAKAIKNTTFSEPSCPIYQNVDALPSTDPDAIKEKLIQQLTASVRWTQTIENMIKDGCKDFVEVGGKGKTLRSLIRRIDRSVTTKPLEV